MATLKLFHLLFLFIWIGSLLSFTRVMGCAGKEESMVQQRLRAITKRTYLFVDLPAMVLAIGSGVILLVWKGVDMKAGWFHMKMTFALLLVAVDVTGAVLLFRGKTRGFKVLHGLAGLFLIAILVSVYILKQKVA